ncbi:MAG TPA: DNA-processing protein DprA [Candidatus Dormibacteraeota bacterium]|nr:DNA-processing protein DprA [Candidatus Dormibacteraeota bacterium]
MEPYFEPSTTFAALRPGRPEPRLTGLWCAGSLAPLSRPSVAIVGTRAATPYGRSNARRIAADLAGAGLCILSGLALGIDAAAHEGALEAGGLTVGVLGSGHGRFYPPRNHTLAERMLAAGGAVLSPFAPEEPARRGQFLARNGVVAALADALLVVEAPARSGALNTASWAAGQIPVLALPGDVDRRASAGCLALLRDGAILVRDALDVLEALGIAPGIPASPGGARGDAAQEPLLALLADGEAEMESLAQRSGLPIPELLGRLAMLELQGSIERRGTRYVLVHRHRIGRS